MYWGRLPLDTTGSSCGPRIPDPDQYAFANQASTLDGFPHFTHVPVTFSLPNGMLRSVAWVSALIVASHSPLPHQPALVLMDIQLPDLDGTAALQRLRADPATAALVVVALTAFAMKDERERFLGAGFDGYLVKPIDVRAFPEQVRAYCARARQAG